MEKVTISMLHTRLFLAKSLLFCAVFLTFLFLMSYLPKDQGVSWDLANFRAAVKGVNDDEITLPNTREPHATQVGFNMTRELMRLNPRIFSALPEEFLPDYKNPCWFEKAMNGNEDASVQERLKENGTDKSRLRCLPYVYIIGQPKCGTTDMFYRIVQHPDVVKGRGKEPHWWTRRRFYAGFDKYLDYFNEAALKIVSRIKKSLTSSEQEIVNHDVITVEASASTLWDNDHWRRELWDTKNNEPPILVANLIRAVQPNARFIVTLRNPTERLYSEYLYFRQPEKSVTNFHERTVTLIDNFKNCLRNYSVRSCAYRRTSEKRVEGNVRLRLGLYEVYLRDWLSIYSRDQIFVQRVEDRSKDPYEAMLSIFSFLQLGPVLQGEDAIFRQNKKNARKREYIKLGSMLPETRHILNEFYRPYNIRLAALLNDTGFLWLENESV